MLSAGLHGNRYPSFNIVALDGCCTPIFGHAHGTCSCGGGNKTADPNAEDVTALRVETLRLSKYRPITLYAWTNQHWPHVPRLGCWAWFGKLYLFVLWERPLWCGVWVFTWSSNHSNWQKYINVQHRRTYYSLWNAFDFPIVKMPFKVMKSTSRIYGQWIMVHHCLLIDINCAVEVPFVLFFICCNFMCAIFFWHAIFLGCGCILYVDFGNLH